MPPVKAKYKGMAVTEFILAFPPFFLLILIVIEFSFMAIDRHLLAAATYSAARGLMIELLSPPPKSEIGSARAVAVSPLNINKLSEDMQDCTKVSAEAMQRAERRAVFKMTATAPSFTQVYNNVMGSIPPSWAPPSLPNIEAPDGLLTAILAYPTAAMFTHIVDCKMSQQGLSLTVRYFHSPKTPYAGTVVWAMWALANIEKYTLNGVQATLDSNFFGVKVRSDLAGTLPQEIAKALVSMNKANFNLVETANALSNMTELGKYIKLTDYKSKLEEIQKNHLGPLINPSAVDQLIGPGLSGLAGIDQMIAAQERVATTLLYIVPEALRVVPMDKTITLAWDSGQFLRHRPDTWAGHGFNFLLAPFKKKDGSSASSFTDSTEAWENWSKSLVTTGSTTNSLE